MIATYDLRTIRADFPILKREIYGKPLVYLDNAATTLKPQVVIDTLAQHYALETANIHRGVHYLSEQATAAYERTRGIIKDFIHAAEAREIIFTRGTTDSINLVAQSYGRVLLKAGDEILISHMEHHSNIVPWQMLCQEKGCVLKVIPITDAGELDYGAFEKLLSSKTQFVSIVHVSNSLGTVNPIKKIIAAAHRVGAKVLIDAAQSVSSITIDVQALDCDFLAFSAHKLFGPTGVGVLYGREELLTAMPPVQGGGDMIASVTFEKTTYAELPHKFEAGTPPIAGVIGLGAAINYIQSIGLAAAHEHQAELLRYATAELAKISGVKIIGTAAEKATILSFVIDGIHPHDIGSIVDREGVALRTGHHCTQPVMQRFGVPATARASFSIYNSTQDVDALVAAILKVKAIFL